MYSISSPGAFARSQEKQGKPAYLVAERFNAGQANWSDRHMRTLHEKKGKAKLPARAESREYFIIIGPAATVLKIEGRKQEILVDVSQEIIAS